MKILVTGASGFLGTNLCSQLEAQGHDLIKLNSKNCDLTQTDSLLKFNDFSYDQIYHLAAWTQAGDFCLYHPGEQWIINQQMNTNVLTWWQKHQSQAKFICMGTSCAYDPDLPLVEDNYLTGMPISSLFTYAMTKRMLYAGLLALNKQYGLKYLCLVPSTLYGTGYHTDGRQMHFIFDLIRKIIRGKLYGESVILWGDGTQSRELVFVEDFAKLAMQLSQTVDNDIINIGAGEEYQIRHFAKLICEQVGYDFNQIEFDTSRYVGAKSKCLVVNKLKQSLPNFSLTPLELGLTKTIEWFWQEQEKLVPAN
ncbi:NAD-dependent epimerase/dehydratase family protein [Crocosphaera sp. XPORK-15E]|uniref:NAD-dependent epimerase/dehydratase family protein n=1 Tax=Crocosphaera sp. XPORK-15E TaxID=3110247 RepID=UPI002B2019BD|nr:NAD-dependent epimerase/dehydratase family protein [Crocosphaera sp. XPORK-15E]MEA5535457.1 NAD-dependent epimerase/dehydratase family protein [Crocosphaera sp. XPORK-15E]